MPAHDNAKLERYLQEMQGDLPTLPTIATDLIRLSEQPSATPPDFAELIERDPAVAARILRVANSSLYGFAARIQSLPHAITVLGFRTVRNLTLAASLKGTYKRFGATERRLCEHSVVCAPVAAALADQLETGLDLNDVFTAGLLHDLGKTALANTHPEEYGQVLERVDVEHLPFADAERAAFGFDHAALGGRMASRWGLPSILSEVIRLHHDPDLWQLLPEEQARFVAVVALATAILTRLGIGRRAPLPELDLSGHRACETLSLEKPDLEPLLDRCRATAEAGRLLID